MAASSGDKIANQFGVSWFDTNWIPHLNKENVLDYFSERSNPFYDRNCNNEILKMQQRGLEHLENMTGLEYILLHFQEPILYVIRKQKRLSSKQVIPIADYHIIAGTVYQTADVGTIINSRMVSTLFHLDAAFSEAASFSRYHPAKGYSWQFKDKEESESTKKKKAKKKEEPGSSFQCGRVDALLNSLTLKYPFKYVQLRPGERPVPIQDPAPAKPDPKHDKTSVPTSTAARSNPAPAAGQVKQDPKAPSEKRMRFIT